MKEILATKHTSYIKNGWEYVEDVTHAVNVDDWRYEFLNRFNWIVNKDGYIVCYKQSLFSGKVRVAFMHHFIAGYPLAKMHTDHKDNNRNNCVDENLITVTCRQNLQNSTVKNNRLPGVTFQSATNNYRVHIRIKEEHIYLGSFSNQVAAFFAYKKAVEDLGEFIMPYVLEKCYKIIDVEMVHI